jgi:thymidylate kinase
VPGLFVVLEGGDGVGKSTIGRELGSRAGWIFLENPVPPFDAIKDAVLGEVGTMSRLLYFLAANTHASDLIRAATSGVNVVLARYHWSTLVYQSHHAGVPVEDVAHAVYPLLDGLIKPTKTILLTADPTVQVNRICAREPIHPDHDTRHQLYSRNADLLTRYRLLFRHLDNPATTVDTTSLPVTAAIETILDLTR